MGLKNWLWNDNARELFHARDAAGDDTAKSSAGPRGQDQAKKLAKGSAAFSSALLFGTNESQGLLRTLGEASGENNRSRKADHPDDSEELTYRYDKLDGPGYYIGGLKVIDSE